MLQALLNPCSVAIIGVSKDPKKNSNRPLRFLLEQGYKGEIFLVNPNYTEINNLPCYPSVDALPAVPDLAIVTLRAELVLEALQKCACKGVKGAVVFSSGFAEVGQEGVQLQKQIANLAQETGMRICGPNSVGIVNIKDGMAATFSQALEKRDLRKGPVAFITQSGAFGTNMFSLAMEMGIGFAYFISTGNEADLEFSEYGLEVLKDARVNALAGYVEGFRNGPRFFKLADQALKVQKPLIILKVGRTETAKKAALSHTGTLTGTSATYAGIFRQKGVISAEDETELLDYLSLISTAQNLPSADARVALITTSGGAGVLMSDKCEEYGLPVAELQEETKKSLREILPPFASVQNPVDLTGEILARPDLLAKSLKIILADPNVNTIILFIGLLRGIAPQLAEEIVQVAQGTDKFLALAWVGIAPEVAEFLRQNHIPIFTSPTPCIRAVSGFVKYQQACKRHQASVERQGRSILSRQDVAVGIRERLLASAALGEYKAKKILQDYGLPITREVLASTLEEALAAAAQIGYPIAMKVQSPQILHKTDAGVVRLNIANPEEIRTSWQELIGRAKTYAPEAEIEGLLVQEMVKDAREVVIGLKNDPLGLIIMFGLGGIFVEVLKDVVFRSLPLTEADIEDMLLQVQGFKLLEGYRGKPRADIRALKDLITKVAAFGLDFREEIEEMDLNPVAVLPEGKGVKILDGRIITRVR